MRTTVDLHPKLLKRLRVEARRRGLTVKRLLASLLERGLAERPVRHGRYKCPTFAMGEPRVPLDRALAVATALEDEESARKLSLRK